MKWILTVLISFALIFTMTSSTSSIIDTAKQTSIETSISKDVTTSQIAEKLPILVNLPNQQQNANATEIVKYLLDALGALLTTIIMFFLHKWFPTVFASAKIKDYIKKEKERSV